MKQKYIDAYMDVAERFGKLSSAVRLQVGAIAVKDDRIVSLGYNGTPHGWDNDCEYTIYAKDDKQNWQGVDNLAEQYPYTDMKASPTDLHQGLKCSTQSQTVFRNWQSRLNQAMGLSCL